MNIFPSSTARTPDLFNLVKIHKEISTIEGLILDARYIGEKELTVSSTVFTDTTVNTAVSLDKIVTGTASFNTNTEVTTLPGTTLDVNDVKILFKIIVDGSSEFNNTDTVFPITTNGSLQLGATPTATNLTNIMTLDGVVAQINLTTATTGILAAAVLNTGTNKYFLRLTKDNVVNSNTLIISGTSTATVLTNLGFTVSSNHINITSIASQVNDTTLTGVVDGTGPFNLKITTTTGTYINGGTSLTALGFTTTVNLTTNVISLASHGFSTGDQVTLTSPKTLPGPLAAFPNSLYYIVIVDVNSFKLAKSASAALAGTVIDISSHGTSYFTIVKTTDAEMYYQVWKSFGTNPVYKERMDDVIAHFEDKQYIIYRQTNSSTSTTFKWIIKW